MKNKHTVNSVYKLNPDTIEFNDEYVGFNPVHSEEEYASTKVSIEEHGQLKPIYMLDGKCVDGRHRTSICKELGIKVLAIDLDKNLNKRTIYDLCNIDTMAGRNLTPTQRAIAALEYKERLKISQQDAAKKFQVTRQNVMYADKLRNVYGQSKAVKALHEGKAVQLSNMDKPSKSLEFICKKAKELYEEAIVVEDRSRRIQFDPEATISTEIGKQWYYTFIRSRNIPEYDIELRMILADYANSVYKIEDNENERASIVQGESM